VRRRWPIVLSLGSLALGLLYLFFWNPVVNGNPDWAVSVDLWGIFRGAHYVGWGDIGGVYAGQTGVVAFPGMEVLLAPLAMLSDHLTLTESFGFWVVTRPSAALLLVPAELILGSTVVFATDALAERLGVARRRRLVLCLSVAVVSWPTAAVWGHAEDSLSLAFVLWAMIALLDRRWKAVGWLTGFGIAVQPLAALLLPLYLAVAPKGQRAWLLVRALLLSVVLVGGALLTAPAATLHSIVDEPTPASVNHATPWVAFAPRVSPISPFAVHVSRTATVVEFLGRSVIVPASQAQKLPASVAGGPARLIDLVFVIAVGLYAFRRPQTPLRLVWLVCAVLASRCFFEPVMTPYYLELPLVACLALGSTRPSKRWWASVALALEVMVFSYHHLEPWAWWLPVVASLLGILWVVRPVQEESEAQGIPTNGTEPVGISFESSAVDEGVHPVPIPVGDG
jgi:hypothetical protein